MFDSYVKSVSEIIVNYFGFSRIITFAENEGKIFEINAIHSHFFFILIAKTEILLCSV